VEVISFYAFYLNPVAADVLVKLAGAGLRLGRVEHGMPLEVCRATNHSLGLSPT